MIKVEHKKTKDVMFVDKSQIQAANKNGWFEVVELKKVKPIVKLNKED